MSSLKFDLPTVSKSLCTLLGVVCTANGIYSLASPTAAIASFGLPLQDPTPRNNDNTEAIIRAFGGRTLAYGLTLLMLAYRDLEGGRLLGMAVLAGITSGSTDLVVTWRGGLRDKAWGHTIGTAMFAVSAAYLVFGT